MQPESEIEFHPTDLREFGLNPQGKPLYRVVRADTRMSKVICNGKRHVIPRYFHERETRGKWVLERWAGPEVIVGMNREQYAAFLAAFPNAAAEEFPEHGDYELARIFDQEDGPFAKNIDEMALHKQLAFHEWRHRNQTSAERSDSDAKLTAQSEAQASAEFDKMYDEAREEHQCLQA